MSDNFLPVQGQDYYFAGSGCGITDTSITFVSLTLPNSSQLITMAMFGTIGYATFEPNSPREENISFTGLTQNANGTATLTGITRGLKFVSPFDQDLTLRKSHAGSVVMRFTNSSAFYNQLAGKNDDETIGGTWTFTNPNYPRMDTATPAPTDDAQLATKKYVDDTAIAGAPDATLTVKGIVEIATTSEINSGTSLGTTGASIVARPDQLAASIYGLQLPTSGQKSALIGNNTDIAVGSGNLYVTQTGLQHGAENYAVDTSGSSTAYVAVLSPVPTSLTAGMALRIKFVNANTTTTPTLTLTGTATAKTIVKDVSTALEVGDISANMIGDLIYDGTNFVLQNPTIKTLSYVNGSASQTLTGNATQTITHGLGKTPKKIRVSAYAGDDSFVAFGVGSSNGSWDSSGQSYAGINFTGATAKAVSGSSAAISVGGIDSTTTTLLVSAVGVVQNVGATTFEIAWTPSFSAGTQIDIKINWEAEAL